jgi:hypothetical protein
MLARTINFNQRFAIAVKLPWPMVFKSKRPISQRRDVFSSVFFDRIAA